ncbi:hypothetical protein As57867_005531, partial [Aphanomyces stellatus]
MEDKRSKRDQNNEWNNLRIDVDLFAGDVPVRILSKVLPSDCSLAYMTIGLKNLNFRKKAIQIIMAPIKIFVRENQTRSLMKSLDEVVREVTFFNEDLIVELEQGKTVIEDRRHILQNTTNCQMAMHDFVDACSRAGIDRVYCSNFGMKSSLNPDSWYMKILEYCSSDKSLSFQMDFGIDATDLVANLVQGLPPPQSSIWGLKMDAFIQVSPTTQVFPLFTSTDGKPALKYFTCTQHDEFIVEERVIELPDSDDSDSDEDGIQHVQYIHYQLLKFKWYSEIVHLIKLFNKLRKLRRLQDDTTVKSAKSIVASMAAFLLKACTNKNFAKCGGSRFEFTFKISSLRQIQHISEAIKQCVQKIVAPYFAQDKVGFLTIEEYTKINQEWLDWLNEAAPRIRDSNRLPPQFLHCLNSAINGNDLWSYTISRNLILFKGTYKLQDETFESRLLRLSFLEGFLKANYPKLYILHKNPDLWPILQKVEFVFPSNINFKGKQVSTVFQSPTMWVRSIYQPTIAHPDLRHVCPVVLAERILKHFGALWIFNVKILPQALWRKIGDVIGRPSVPNTEEVQRSHSGEKVPALVRNQKRSRDPHYIGTLQPIKKIPPSSMRPVDYELEKILFETDNQGLNELKRRITIQHSKS